MTQLELDQRIAALPPGRRRVYEGIRDGGPLTQTQLHKLLGRSGSVRFTHDLRPLLADGLIRSCGRRRNGSGGRTDLFEAVPAAEVETAKAQNTLNQTVWELTGRTNAVVASYKNKVERLRKLEAGSARQWIRMRRRIVDLTSELVVLNRDNMAFWECSDPDDRLDVVEELFDLHGWCERTIEEFADRLDDDDLREKVAQIRDVHGRTQFEVENHRRRADKLARKLARRR
jgi:hypothetical protein